MHIKIATLTEFLLTNVTYQPSTFTVWLQQMCLEIVKPCKTLWTVSTWVRFCTSVNTNMTLQITACHKQLPTVRTVIRSSIAVYLTFMSLQADGLAETFVTQCTLVWFISLISLVYLGDDEWSNICHILCICIYLYEYSYAFEGRPEMKNVSHTEYMNTHFLQCVFFCAHSNSHAV